MCLSRAYDLQRECIDKGLDSFTAFMQTIPDKGSRPVKIAVIGNSIDESIVDILHGKVARSR